MTKITFRQTNIPEFGNYVNNLWSAFTLLTSKDEIRKLFKDLFTHTEYKMFAKRLEIARSLLAGQGYQDIRNRLNVTDRTIASVSNILSNAGEGFRSAHGKLSEMEEKFRPKKKVVRISRTTVLGAAIKTGARMADKEIMKQMKLHSARRILEI